MPQTSAIISMTDVANKKIQKSITDVSNNVSNQQLKNFLQGLVALTNNTYGGSSKVVKTNLDGESSTKPVPTVDSAVTLTRNSDNYTYKSVASHYTGTSPIYASCPSKIFMNVDDSISVFCFNSISPGDYIVNLYAPENAIYAEMNTTITVTIE